MRERTNSKELWGREFDIVKEGLDEAQVTVFVNELVTEVEALNKRQEHLLSLTKLAEKTVAEADRIAEDISREAASKATAILARAEADAQKLAEQKRAESRATAEREAAMIKAGAREEAEKRAQEYQRKVKAAMKEGAGSLHGQLLTGLKGVVEQAVSLQAAWDAKLNELAASAPGPAKEEAPRITPMTTQEAEAPQTVSELDVDYRCDVLEQLQQVWVDSEARAPEEPAPPAAAAGRRQAEILEEIIPPAKAARSVPKNYEGTVELEILPPLVPSQLVEIQSYLRDWPGIGIVELRPKNKGYSITIVLDKPTQLIDILKQLPEVKEAVEATEAGVLVGDGPGKDCQRRVLVTVAGRK